jgi:ATP-dependent DNA ligase
MSGSAVELPRTFAPMLAAAEPLPTEEEGWAWEPKWDGWWVLVRAEGGLRVEVQLLEWTAQGRRVTSATRERPARHPDSGQGWRP